MCLSKMWLKFILISSFGCSSILTTSFDLGGVISGNRMAGVPLGRSLGDGEVDVEGVCTESGVTCQNCTHAVTCIPLPIGWLKVPLLKCTEDQTCNAHVGGCSSESAPECQDVSKNYLHTCEQVGIFPDAYDCRKFHLCSPPDGVPSGSPADHRVSLCPRNYGYNPSSAQCSIKLFKGQCTDKPVPDCKTVGDYGVLPSSPNHYYVCLSKRGVLYPQIFICPHGWFFWGGFCRPEPQAPKNSTFTDISTTSEATRLTTSSTTTPKTNSTIPSKTNSTTMTTTNLTTTRITSSAAPKRYSLFEALFSTEKPTTWKQDTFLADRYGSFSENSDTSAVPEAWLSSDEEIFNSWENS